VERAFSVLFATWSTWTHNRKTVGVGALLLPSDVGWGDSRLVLSPIGAQVLAGTLEERLPCLGESREEIRPLLRIARGLGLPVVR
jgi:hypothetical protein